LAQIWIWIIVARSRRLCTKSFVGWAFAPDHTGGAYSAPPDLLAGLGGGATVEREGGRRGK